MIEAFGDRVGEDEKVALGLFRSVGHGDLQSVIHN
jgi:hypothetical protein